MAWTTIEELFGEPAPVVPLLRGRALRFVLVDELRQRPEMSVAELVAAVAAHGFDLGGRASKIISDALRWEVRRGRVTRLRRGWYAYLRAPAATARRIGRLAVACRVWMGAVRHGHEPPTSVPDPRASPPIVRAHRPKDPPWWNLGWLWAS